MSTGNCRRWDESGPEFKQGKFSNAESETVVDAIKTYARAHQVSVQRLCSEGNKKYKGAWITIADCLPERTAQAIYRHGKRKLHGLKMGAWTKEEELKLLSLVEEHGKRWRVIEPLLGRPADTCRDKHREHMTDAVTGQWTEEEEKLLEQAVRGKIKDPGDKLRAIQGEQTGVDWTEVAKKVGTRNRISCLKKWEHLQGKRLKQRLLSDAGSKLSLRLAIAREVLNTGARDETEVVWTKLPYPRAHRSWMALRRDLPSTMPLGVVARAVIHQLEQKMCEVGLSDPVAVEREDIPAPSIEASTPLPSGSRKYDADQSTGQGGESELRRDLRAQGEGASGDDQASSGSTGAGIRVNHEMSGLAPTASCPSTSSPQKRSNGSETRLESALQDDARREALHLQRQIPSNSAKQGRDGSDGSSAEVCGETLEVGRRSRKEKRKKKKKKKDQDSRDGDNREKGTSANRRQKKKRLKTNQATDQRSPLQTGGEAMLWESLSGTEGLASPSSPHWTALDAGFSAIFGLGPGPAQCPAGDASPSEATAEGRRKSKFERMLYLAAEND